MNTEYLFLGKSVEIKCSCCYEGEARSIICFSCDFDLLGDKSTCRIEKASYGLENGPILNNCLINL